MKWLLEDLVAGVPGAGKAILLSDDGLLMTASDGLTRHDADHLAAVAAGYQSLSRSAARVLGGGPVRQTVVEMQSEMLFVMSAGPGACLAVTSSAESDIGLIAYEMAVLVQRVGIALSTPQRPDPQEAETALAAPRDKSRR